MSIKDRFKIPEKIHNIFKRGSTTYFYSSLFFEKEVKKDVFVLYSFVRKADDFVDQIPQDIEGYFKFKDEYVRACSHRENTESIVIKEFVELCKRRNFDKSWVNGFLRSMEMDMNIREYEKVEEVYDYVYGSAEVIGLMLANIMQLPPEAQPSAKMLGRAMQLVNFIRDIEEDTGLGRTYIAKDEIHKFNLDNLKKEYVFSSEENQNNFKQLLRYKIGQYKNFNDAGKKGFIYLDKRSKVAIKTATEMYEYTANIIYNNPLVVYERKVKPNKLKVLATGVKNLL